MTKNNSWRDTLFLPQTDFPMKASLPTHEPGWRAEYHARKCDQRIRDISKKRAKQFILHDGPPYANGDLHMGHALNKVLKDIINRSYFMAGWGIDYRPGWDCHGLPIEWQVEQELRQKKKNDVLNDDIAFRAACRDHASHWMARQKEQFMALGVHGDWDNPYSTMTHATEGAIRAELSHFIMDGSLVRALRPVLWSVAEQTALAEAEVDYKEIESPSIAVAFAVAESGIDALKNSIIPVWTTTSWTLPANVALACGTGLTYLLVKFANHPQLMLVAQGRYDEMRTRLGCDGTVIDSFTGKQLHDARIVTRHPLHEQGFDHCPRVYQADFVRDDSGTGFVHIAPAHGEDDFRLARKHEIETKDIVTSRGVYRDTAPLIGGRFIFKVHEELMEAMGNRVLYHFGWRHSYPHSWRSGTPLIYRTTPQWFISMTHDDLRGKALRAIDEVKWYPEKGRARIQAMIKERPDWCLSRQRRWGVPLAIFQRENDGSLLQDEATEQRIIKAFRDEGADAWFRGDPKRFLAEAHRDAYEPVMDILDVWFDSGCSHSFVLGDTQADLYVEGSDQHRGWFQSSLLHGCGTAGHAPYKNVLTHGFVLDDKGYKLSKSKSDTLTLPKIMAEHGADVLRLWVALADTSEDMKLGHQSLTHAKDHYRRFRNCLRFLLGVLHYHDDSMKLPTFNQLEFPEQTMLHNLLNCDELYKNCLNIPQYPRGFESPHKFHFDRFYNQLHHFCAKSLSAFYLDIRKDCLYCDGKDSPKRRASLAVLALVFDCLCRWLAPVLVFTADEAWKLRHGQDQDLHCHDFSKNPLLSLKKYENEVLEMPWEQWMQRNKISSIRDTDPVTSDDSSIISSITSALEKKRAEIPTNSQAEILCLVNDGMAELLKGIDMRELTMTASFEIVLDHDTKGDIEERIMDENFMLLLKREYASETIKIYYRLTSLPKCSRCWRYEPQDEPHLREKGICSRCHEVCYG